jgi:sarcosine oxidase, subunit beta
VQEEQPVSSIYGHESADVVVVGGGTVGGWCAAFLGLAGAGKVILIEQSLLGRGASSRAAGMVRAQGGTPIAVDLGMWSIDFYRRQHEEFGIDSGFVEQGYFMPAFDEREKVEAEGRIAMQRALGLDVEWIGPDAAQELNPTMAEGICLGGSYSRSDGYIDPPRNVLAYALVLQQAGVIVRERVAFVGLHVPSGRVTGIETTRGVIDTGRVVLTGGPELAAVGRIGGVTIPAGGARHQIAVTEPCPQLAPDKRPMVFDVGAGLYWRPEDGGILFGMSNPEEEPGVAREVDWDYLSRMRERLAYLVPHTRQLALRRTWAATIDFTPDHLPIIGPALRAQPTLERVSDDAHSENPELAEIGGAFVASAGGHGMMWGPAVARATADLCLNGKTDITDISSVGLDRFDSEGRSRLPPDPIALPFPERA